jgi:REP element-mobilizing transposase RayT
MPYARKSLVSLQDTPYYHLVGRCVRRSWLCGTDQYSGKDYSHRKQWVLDRLSRLSKAFTIDICAYAIMSNHYHLVVHIDQRRANSLTPDEVIERWRVVFKIPEEVERWRSGEATSAEVERAERLLGIWRARLSDVSWYMRCLNEHLARRANAEDECTGHFWEQRFKSQALLDETGLLTAMAYVDLNPVRAGIAATPEESNFTSIQSRIAAASSQRSATSQEAAPLKLIEFKAGNSWPQLPFSLKNYLSLVDWTGRRIRKDKAGHIDADQPPILVRLKIDPTAWDATMRRSGNRFGRAMGPLDHLRLHARTLGQAWIRGLNHAAALYRSS